MFSTDTLFHKLNISSDVELPKQLDYPMQYTPRKIAKLAAEELQCYLENQTSFKGDFDSLGKMFGVLVVKSSDGKLGYLSAFSGKIDEKVFIDGFVPPVFDTLNPNGFYKLGEEKLNQINKEIDEFENDTNLLNFKQQLVDAKEQQEKEIEELRVQNRNAKQLRNSRREEAEKNLSETELVDFVELLKKESIRQNYELKDLKRNWIRKIEQLEKAFNEFEKPLRVLKEKRKTFSAELQEQLHKSYRFLNANGQEKDLLTIFDEIQFRLPAGTGECCAPKLFQYAFQHNLQPIAMAEFWWGKSPASEVKTHKEYYPACKGKCKPVLGWMLQGLDVKENPVKNRKNIELEIKYEDEYLLVLVKPYRFLSVPGREIEDSVYTRMKEKYPDVTGPIMVHRLDMGTSGLLVVAKKAEVHKDLQHQFTARTVKKRYIAVLDGIVEKDSGTIDLPLRVDYNNRPRQLVCFEKGRPALTHFEVIERKDGKTKIHLYPETGRTHQLRVHCAHHLGLNRVMYGDDLYGTTQDRLYLHAERLEFTHPITKERMSFFCESGF